MTEQDKEHPREDDRNDELDESPVPDPTDKERPSEDDPEADQAPAHDPRKNCQVSSTELRSLAGALSQ
jgi:hypothetical protein